jgi:hypothetical protein
MAGERKETGGKRTKQRRGMGGREGEEMEVGGQRGKKPTGRLGGREKRGGDGGI